MAGATVGPGDGCGGEGDVFLSDGPAEGGKNIAHAHTETPLSPSPLQQPLVPPTSINVHIHSRLISFYDSQTEHALEMKLTPIDFSCQAVEDSRSSWLQTLVTDLSIVPHTLGILTASRTCCILFLE